MHPLVLQKIDGRRPADPQKAGLATISVRLVATAAACLAGVGAVFAALIVHEPPIAPVTRPDPASFPATQIQRGARLASIGNCTVCHTEAGGRPFAGDRPLPTPFGTIFVSNVTPDPATGIGTWSSDAFRRAMTRGISQDGTHLYPIMRFQDMPDSVEVLVLDRPGLPFLGTAECAQGPASAALANALADATGLRLRDMPLDARAVKAGLGVG